MPKTAPRSRKYYIRLVEFGLLALIILLYISYPITYAYSSTRPAPSSLGKYLPSDFGQPYEDVLITAPDGIHLSGWYIPSQNKAAVILLHGYGSSRLNMFVHAEMLARHGYGVLLYDARASGLSEGTRRSFGWQDVNDMRAVLDYVKSRPDVDPTKIGIAGISTGGEIALGAAVRYPEVAAVLADGTGFPTQADIPAPTTFEDYYMKPLTPILFATLEVFSGARPPQPLTKTIQTISPCPIFLISTGEDMEKRQADLYYSLAEQPKVHWNLPKSSHGHAVYTNKAEYETRMIAFFEEGLLINE